MKSSDFDIVKYSAHYKDQILDVWEKSVLATHDFIAMENFESI
jgi:putative acetyltransferase